MMLEEPKQEGAMLVYASGATRSGGKKLNYPAYFCPAVLKRRAEYMREHEIDSNDEPRTGDNWKRGLEIKPTFASLFRHVVQVWTLLEQGDTGSKELQDTLCAIDFNADGMLNAILRSQSATTNVDNPSPIVDISATPVEKRSGFGHIVLDNDLGYKVVKE